MTQYRNFDFNSMCMFNGVPIAAGSSGISSLNDAEKDNTTNIKSVIELRTSNFGVMHPKRFRSFYVGYETSGSIKFSVTVDGGTTAPFTLVPKKTGQIQHMGKLPLSRAQKGTYWMYKIENVNGCDFSLDHIQGIPIILSKSR